MQEESELERKCSDKTEVMVTLIVVIAGNGIIFFEQQLREIF